MRLIFAPFTAVLKMDQVLAKVIGFRKVTGKLLEELAIAHETARLLVRYSRCQKRLRNIETLIQSVQNGRVHPVFSQTRTDHCRLSSVKPRLFDSDDFRDLRSCLSESLRQFFPDSRKALGIVADEASDKVLRSDLVDAEGCWGPRLSALIPTNLKCHLKNELAVNDSYFRR